MATIEARVGTIEARTNTALSQVQSLNDKQNELQRELGSMTTEITNLKKVQESSSIEDIKVDIRIIKEQLNNKSMNGGVSAMKFAGASGGGASVVLLAQQLLAMVMAS